MQFVDKLNVHSWTHVTLRSFFTTSIRLSLGPPRGLFPAKFHSRTPLFISFFFYDIFLFINVLWHTTIFKSTVRSMRTYLPGTVRIYTAGVNARGKGAAAVSRWQSRKTDGKTKNEIQPSDIGLITFNGRIILQAP